MLYFGLLIGTLLGSLMTVILMALTKEVSLEKESGSSSLEIIRRHNKNIKKEDSLNTAV